MQFCNSKLHLQSSCLNFSNSLSCSSSVLSIPGKLSISLSIDCPSCLISLALLTSKAWLIVKFSLICSWVHPGSISNYLEQESVHLARSAEHPAAEIQPIWNKLVVVCPRLAEVASVYPSQGARKKILLKNELRSAQLHGVGKETTSGDTIEN